MKLDAKRLQAIEANFQGNGVADSYDASVASVADYIAERCPELNDSGTPRVIKMPDFIAWFDPENAKDRIVLGALKLFDDAIEKQQSLLATIEDVNSKEFTDVGANVRKLMSDKHAYELRCFGDQGKWNRPSTQGNAQGTILDLQARAINLLNKKLEALAESTGKPRQMYTIVKNTMDNDTLSAGYIRRQLWVPRAKRGQRSVLEISSKPNEGLEFAMSLLAESSTESSESSSE